jgi:hypothetical protein
MFKLFGFLALKDLQLIWISNVSDLRVPDVG